MVQERLHVSYVVGTNGGYTETVQSLIRPTNSATAEQLKSLAIKFSYPLETLELLSATLYKADGQQVRDVDCRGIPQSVAQRGDELPMFNVRQQKVITWPNLASGDCMALSYRRICTRPLIDGHFMLFGNFRKSLPWNDVLIRLRAPAMMGIGTNAEGVSSSKNAGRRLRVAYLAVARHRINRETDEYRAGGGCRTSAVHRDFVVLGL